MAEFEAVRDYGHQHLGWTNDPEPVVTSPNYTPSTESVRVSYIAFHNATGDSGAELRAEFDRWLAQIRSETP